MLLQSLKRIFVMLTVWVRYPVQPLPGQTGLNVQFPVEKDTEQERDYLSTGLLERYVLK